MKLELLHLFFFLTPGPESMLVPLLPPSVPSGFWFIFTVSTSGVKSPRMHLLRVLFHILF